MKTVEGMISVVIPVYGANDTLPVLCERIVDLLEGTEVPFEILFVDDCGPGDAWACLMELTKRYPQVTCIGLMRNFGQHNALMCGFHHARGEIVVTMDDDLQHEPESIPRLLKRLHETRADLVYGAYDQKRHGRSRNLGSWLVTRFYRLVFKVPIAPTSFRAMRKELVDAILRYDLNFTYIDGLLAWNTQRIDQVVVPHHERSDGKSGYTLGKLVALAMNMFTNFSLLPLQISGGVGFTASVIGLSTGAYYLMQGLLRNIEVPGYASIIVAVMVLGGLQLMALGVIGEYVGRLHLNMNRKPQFTVRRIFRHAKTLADAGALSEEHLESSQSI